MFLNPKKTASGKYSKTEDKLGKQISRYPKNMQHIKESWHFVVSNS